MEDPVEDPVDDLYEELEAANDGSEGDLPRRATTRTRSHPTIRGSCAGSPGRGRVREAVGQRNPVESSRPGEVHLPLGSVPELRKGLDSSGVAAR